MGVELVHFMIPAEDPGKLSGFYHNVLDWTIEPVSPEFPDYLAITTSNREDMPCGGMMEKMAVPGMGYFSVCLDPEGNPFGLWLEDENAS